MDLARVLRRRELLKLDVAVGEQPEGEGLPRAVGHAHADVRLEDDRDGPAADREHERDAALDHAHRHLLDRRARDALDCADDVALHERPLLVGGTVGRDRTGGHLAIPQVDRDAERAVCTSRVTVTSKCSSLTTRADWALDSDGMPSSPSVSPEPPRRRCPRRRRSDATRAHPTPTCAAPLRWPGVRAVGPVARRRLALEVLLELRALARGGLWRPSRRRPSRPRASLRLLSRSTAAAIAASCSFLSFSAAAASAPPSSRSPARCEASRPPPPPPSRPPPCAHAPPPPS